MKANPFLVSLLLVLSLLLGACGGEEDPAPGKQPEKEAASGDAKDSGDGIAVTGDSGGTLKTEDLGLPPAGEEDEKATSEAQAAREAAAQKLADYEATAKPGEAGFRYNLAKKDFKLAWIFVVLGLLLVLADFLFPVDWAAYLGYVFFAFGVVGLFGAYEWNYFITLFVVVLLALLVLHKVWLTRFLTNSDDAEEGDGQESAA